MISLIVAYASNHVIGNKGTIPWRIKGEQKRFKELTTGNVVIMGRRSYEEIGHPLPNRLNIIVSNTKKFEGARLYEEALPLVEKMYVTEIDREIEGDTYFPDFDASQFDKEIVERHDDGEIPFTYVTYTRKDSIDGAVTKGKIVEK